MADSRIKYPTAASIDPIITDYLATCKAADKPPVMFELAGVLKVHRDVPHQWNVKFADEGHKLHHLALAYARVKAATESYFLAKGCDNSTRNSSFAQFCLQAYCGKSVKQQLDVQAKGQLVVDTGIPSLVGYQAANREADSE